MKTRTILLIMIFLLLPAMPVWAYSDLAEDFLLACRQFDTPFPPDDWTVGDLRDAALEVLDAYETDGADDWAVYFCLIALGHTCNPDDLERILNYEDTMPEVVLRSLAGFPDPVAIECLLRWLDSDDPNYRELSIKGLGDIDFDALEEPDVWRETIIDELSSARDAETIEPIAELLDETVGKIEGSATGTQ